MKIEKIKCIYVFLFTFHFIFFGCSKEMKQTSPKKQSEEVSEILNSLKQQEKMLVRLQSLTADQILRNSELEQSIPPRDLLESLQNGLVDLRAKTIILEKQVSELQKGLEFFAINLGKICVNDLQGILAQLGKLDYMEV